MTTTAPPGLSRTGSEVVTAARLLAADAVEAAQSGHPGAAISLAPVATLLYGKHIRHDPQDPDWAGATGSSCPAGTRACCSTHSSTSPGTSCPSTT